MGADSSPALCPPAPPGGQSCPSRALSYGSDRPCGARRTGPWLGLKVRNTKPRCDGRRDSGQAATGDRRRGGWGERQDFPTSCCSRLPREQSRVQNQGVLSPWAAASSFLHGAPKHPRPALEWKSGKEEATESRLGEGGVSRAAGRGQRGRCPAEPAQAVGTEQAGLGASLAGGQERPVQRSGRPRLPGRAGCVATFSLVWSKPGAGPVERCLHRPTPNVQCLRPPEK
ncbi:uncharacterized protein LOC104848476 [Fukomys damarensis]|uniref:uncharacterized protein LOC104848476 n=1 Tax=Fukomys damarensis TaxID=885580 RepID=UPI00053F8C72|nr:uncharacterized protein LOC104848476 [Fukomys damarensis]